MISGRKEGVLRSPHESKIYSEFSHLYDGIFSRFFCERITSVITSLNIHPGAKVLEVGVGTGLSLAAYPSHCEVTGIDLAPEMLERARQKAAENGWRHFRLLEMDALNLQFPDNSFDYVTSFHVISVVPDPVRMMREVHRVCKPGGTVVIINHFRTTKQVFGLVIHRRAGAEPERNTQRQGALKTRSREAFSYQPSAFSYWRLA
ncbi:MAG: methyltransferase domain-containing protein [Deltaproteobacteria bacterium]|nr:methyltransferase domain-containing protein [Deltaproteobacteria bacterium]